MLTGSPRALVAPLIESLQHPMLAEDRWLQEQLGSEGIPFDQALRSSVEASRVWKRPIVRSVQRFPRPKEHSARSVGLRYPEWLSTWSSWFLGIEWEESAGPVLLGGAGWESEGILNFVVVRRDAEYLLYYSSGQNRQHRGVGLARSPDGIAWVRHPKKTSAGHKEIVQADQHRPAGAKAANQAAAEGAPMVDVHHIRVRAQGLEQGL